VLARTEGFATAQEIHSLLVSSGSKVGLATVYRRLAAMTEAGEVDALMSPSGEMVYRRCAAAGEHHHHLICRLCGRTLEFEGKEVEAWAARVAREASFVDVSHTVEIFGTCPRCARSRSAGGSPGGARSARSKGVSTPPSR
jgi:Fur family ferric uptake transcriptional regulator